MRREIHTDALTWLDLVDPTEQDTARLAEEFHFHPLDIAELTRRSPRPRVEEHPGYLFLVVHVPVYDATSRTTSPAEVDIFVTAHEVVTVHLGRVHLLDQFFREVNEETKSRERYVGRGAAYLLYSIMDRLLEASFPKLDHIREKIEAAEHRMFLGEERSLVVELSTLKRDLSGFRTIIRPQVHLYDPGTLHGDVATPAFSAVFRSITLKLSRVWDTLEILQENVATLAETNANLVSYKLNEFIKVLTFLGAIFIPFGLIAQVIIPLAETTSSVAAAIFWVIIAGMLIVDLLLLWYSRSRRIL